MSTRTLNFTGRDDILRRDVAVSIEPEGDNSYRFSAEIHLADYNLPENALVFVEAYRQTQYERFSFGVAGEISPPVREKRNLDEFISPDGVLFRVKVTDPEEGLLLAGVDQIQPERKNEQVKESLLPVLPVSLEQECWRVYLGDPRPVFQIHKESLPNWKDASKSPVFRALVYPAVVREILTHILQVAKYCRTDENDNWMSLWLRFATGTLHMDKPPNPNDDPLPGAIENWIAGAVSAFSVRIKAFDLLKQQEDAS